MSIPQLCKVNLFYSDCPLRQHLLHNLDRRGDHNVTVAGSPSALAAGVVSSGTNFFCRRSAHRRASNRSANRFCSSLACPTDRFLEPITSAGSAGVSRSSTMTAPVTGAAQLTGARSYAEAAAQGQALRLRQSDHILKSRQNALAAVKAFLVVTNRLFTPIHSLLSLSFVKSYYSDRSLDSSSSFRSR